MRVLTRVAQFAELRASERRLVMLSLVVVAPVRAALCVLPSSFILRLVRRLGDARAREPRLRRPAAERIAWAIAAASCIVPRATCLTQAVAGMLLLRHYGYESRLCLGVTKSRDGTFAAHAWVELERHILIGGPQSAAFTPLPLLAPGLRQDTPHGAR